MVVVDNGSSDGTVEAVRAAAPAATVIANPTNRGLPAANNQGMLAAAGEYLVISNPDVVYSAGAVDALLDLLDRRPHAGFAFACLHHPDGTVQTCTGDLPTLREALTGRAARVAAPRPAPPWLLVARLVPRPGDPHRARRRVVLRHPPLDDRRDRCAGRAVPPRLGGHRVGRACGRRGVGVVVLPRRVGRARRRREHPAGADALDRVVARRHVPLFESRVPGALRPFLATTITARALVKVARTYSGTHGYDGTRSGPAPKDAD